MKIKPILLLLCLFFVVYSTDYHGFLNQKNNYYNGDFIFDKSKLPLNTTKFSSLQLRHPESLNEMLIQKININLQVEYRKIVHIKITDKENKDRWEVPSDVISFNYSYNLERNKGSVSNLFDLVFTNKTDIFSFELKDKNGNTFYTFSNETFIFADKYINFESFLTSDDIYGFGEHSHNIKLGNGIFTIWPNDTGGIKEDLGVGGKNLYSHQPIAIHKTKFESLWLGFIFLNSNNQDVVIKDLDNGLTSLQHKTIGGVIDYYIIVDTSPEEVIKNIQNLLGHPFLPPIWSLGSQQCRYGYNTLETFENVYNNYTLYNIPLDCMWIDIDSMDDFQIFTVDKKNFEGLPDFISKIHEEHCHFVPIVDIGVSSNTKSGYATLGDKLNVFIKSNYTKKNMVIKVWPGETLIPDFFNPNTSIYWQYGLKNYQDLVHFDGIWLDMNEVANLNKEAKCIGEEGEICDKKDNYFYFDDLPYLPGFDGEERTNMASGTINENGIIYGSNSKVYAVYNTKPFLTYLESKETYNFIYNIQKTRPFILTRSATFGSGKYNAHWLGDNYANYKSMRNSLNGIFQFDIFGIPVTGDDICGFFDDTNEILCNRWYNLGAFYAFSRNHNFEEAIDQYPWSFNNETILNNIRQAVNYRYSLLRYIYSHIFSTSLNEKVGFFNPVFFEFPNEEESYKNIDEKAMIGDAFILFPIFSDSLEDIKVNFPLGKWNIYPSGKIKKSFKEKDRSSTLSGDLNIIHLYLRGGYIVPYQSTKPYIKNTFELRQNPINIIINPDENHKAKGTLFFDNDGLDTILKTEYIRVDLNYDNYVLFISSFKKYNFVYEYKDLSIDIIEILGETIKKEEKEITHNLSCNIIISTITSESDPFPMDYDEENDKFYISLKQQNLQIIEIKSIRFNFEESN